MKKISILCVSAMFAVVSFAQPSAGSFGVEINFNPAGLFDGGANTFTINGLNVHYLIADNMAIRGILNFTNNSSTDALYGAADNKLVSTTKTTTSLFSFRPGFEYHLVTAEKYSLYTGAQIGFATGSSKTSLTFADSNASAGNTELKGSRFDFTVGVFTGVNYFVTQNIYIGAELGLNYLTSKNTPAASRTAGSTTTKNDSYNTNGTVGFNVTPNFRLGWNF